MSSCLVVGTVFMDCKGFADHRYDPLGRNVGSVKFIHGGVGRNVAENLANIGISTSFLSSVDESALGRDVIARLQKKGIDTSRVAAAPSGMGIWLAVMDQNGELVSSISQMPDLKITEEYVDRYGEDAVRDAECVVLELDLTDGISKKILDMAERQGRKVYGITGNMEVILRNPGFLARTECYICNEIEAGRLFQTSLLGRGADETLDVLTERAKELHIRSMAITMAERGAVYFDARSGEKGYCPAVKTRVRDSSGAGDAFFSGMVSGLMEGRGMAASARLGSRLASWTIQTEGPTCYTLPEALIPARG